jgi:hypothetical protein
MTEVDVIGDAARCMVAIAHASLAARRAFVPRNQSALSSSSSGSEEATISAADSETEAEWRARANGLAVAAARLGAALPDGAFFIESRAERTCPHLRCQLVCSVTIFLKFMAMLSACDLPP